MIDEGSSGSLYGATPTTNSSEAVVITASDPGSWSSEDLKTEGTSFGYWNPTIDSEVAIPPGGQVLAQLYEMQPSNISSVSTTLLGTLILTKNGLSFQAAVGPSAPFNILSIARSGNNINLTWVAPGGTTNYVQATNGSNGSYATNGFGVINGPIVNGGMASTAVTNSYTDLFGATNRPARYYRISQLP